MGKKEERMKIFREDYANGTPVDEIAEKLNVSKISKSMMMKEEYLKGLTAIEIAEKLNTTIEYAQNRVRQFAKVELNRNRGRLPHLEKNGLLTESMYRARLIRDPIIMEVLKERYENRELKRQKKIERARRYQEKANKKDTSANKPSN